MNVYIYKAVDGKAYKLKWKLPFNKDKKREEEIKPTKIVVDKSKKVGKRKVHTR